MNASTLFARHRWAAALLAVALLGLGAWRLIPREQRYPLPGGGEVSLVKVVYAGSLEVRDPGFELDDLRDWLGPDWSRLLGPYPGSCSFGGGDEPELMAAFACRGRNGGNSFDNGTYAIDLPGGQTLAGEFGGGAGDPDKYIAPATFTLAPFTERRLKLRLMMDGQTFRFDVPNPSYRRVAARWQAQPLPQTRTVDGLEITLEHVTATRYDNPNWRWIGSPWMALAKFTVRFGGQDVSAAVDCRPLFGDRGGNESEGTALFSEPVWKVRTRAVKNESFPFTDAEVDWLGRVPVPGPGEAHRIPLTPATRDARLSFLALAGPGHFRVADGKITAIPAPTDPEVAKNPIRSSYPAQDGREVIEIDTEGVELLSVASTGLAGGQEGGPPIIFLRDDAGRRLPLKLAHGVGSTSLLTVPVAEGTREVEAGLREVRELNAEFFVKAPAPPTE